MLRELGMLIDRVVAEHPLILLLEDLHWSDYATLDAIDVLARQTAPARLMVSFPAGLAAAGAARGSAGRS